MAVRTHPKDSDGQGQLFHEDVYAALTGLVSAVGGAKAVAGRVFPDLGVDQAARRLLDCLNPDRRDLLTPTQLVLLLKIGRDAGHHGAMHYLTDEVGYTRPSPIDPDDQKAEQQRQFVTAVAQLAEMAKRLQR